MNLGAQNLIPLTTSSRFRLHAYSTPAKINIEQLKGNFLPAKIERYSRDCTILHRYDEEKIFVFKFGAVVFFNVPVAEHEHYLLKLGIGPVVHSTAIEDAEGMTEDHLILSVEPGPTKVMFNSVSTSELDITRVELIAQVMAQSSALEIIEREVESFLAESESMARLLKTRGWVTRKRAKLIKFLGEGLTARHRLISQLSLLQEPDKTWEKEELYVLYKALFDNFDIKERLDAIEKMFTLSTHATELLLEIVNARRSELLELVIIILICFEILKSFFG